MQPEHQKKKIYDQEDIIDFFYYLPLPPETTVYIPDEKTAGS